MDVACVPASSLHVRLRGGGFLRCAGAAGLLDHLHGLHGRSSARPVPTQVALQQQQQQQPLRYGSAA
jgi:hypothetical protein